MSQHYNYTRNFYLFTMTGSLEISQFVELLGSLLSLVSNVFLLVLIHRFSHPEYGSYKILMILMAGLYVVYSAIEVLVMPSYFVFEYNYLLFTTNYINYQAISQYLIITFCATFGAMQMVLAFQFIFRYMSVACSPISRHMFFEGRRHFLWIGATFLYFSNWFIMAILFFKNSGNHNHPKELAVAVEERFGRNISQMAGTLVTYAQIGSKWAADEQQLGSRWTAPGQLMGNSWAADRQIPSSRRASHVQQMSSSWTADEKQLGSRWAAPRQLMGSSRTADEQFLGSRKAVPRRQTGRSWASYGQLLGNSWAAPGQQMGSSWATHGQLLGSRWAAPGQQMGSSWASDVQLLGNSWAAPGHQIGSRWKLCKREWQSDPKLSPHLPDVVPHSLCSRPNDNLLHLRRQNLARDPHHRQHDAKVISHTETRTPTVFRPAHPILRPISRQHCAHDAALFVPSVAYFD
uniref:Uncharacterized protein n=1 Tax=Caenorhabditis japonica TaxID=281687 RepID=A0A8R1HL78_CAEJA